MSRLDQSPDTMQPRVTEAAEFMRLFSTPSRLMLLCHIARKERSVGEMQVELDFKQPALSQQLAELRQAGLVQAQRRSRQIYYSIADERVAVVMDMLLRMFCDVEPEGVGGVKAGPAVTMPAAVTSRTPAVTIPLGEMARWARLERAD